MIGSRFPGLGTGPMLFVVITPTWGASLNSFWMMGVAVATIPEGIVKGPDIVLPRNSYFNDAPRQHSARIITKKQLGTVTVF